MQYITKQDLIALGIAINNVDSDALIDHLNEQLVERIGVEIAEQLEDGKLVEYIKFQETASDEAIERWLQDNIPDFQVIFQDEIDILLGELAENADNLNQLT